MVGIGILALVYGDFAMVWQPVPSWIPGRTLLAYGSGLIMLLGGVGLFLRATAAWSARILFPYLIVWVLLKVPACWSLRAWKPFGSALASLLCLWPEDGFCLPHWPGCESDRH